MELILLDNFYGTLRGGTGRATDATFVGLSGTTRHIDVAFVNTGVMFRNTYPSTVQTAADNTSLFFYAASDATIAHDAYNVTRVGSTTQNTDNLEHGYANVVTITHNADATITHLVAVRDVYYGSGSGNHELALIFALKLDNPVQLNSSNNYTANFAIGIEF